MIVWVGEVIVKKTDIKLVASDRAHNKGKENTNLPWAESFQFSAHMNQDTNLLENEAIVYETENQMRGLRRFFLEPEAQAV